MKTIKECIHFVDRRKQRYLNQIRVSEFLSESNGWKKYDGNPVYFIEGTSVFDPFVRWYDNEFIMCVSHREQNALAFSYSKDGIKWHNTVEILTGDKLSTWDSIVNRGCFLVKDGLWYLWYTGQNGHKSVIGLATSIDGVNFSRYLCEPIISADKEYEGLSVMNPCVMWDDSIKRFRMWYAAGENYEPDVLCYAESTDGINWDKFSTPVLTADKTKKYRGHKVGACDVVRLYGGVFLMAYIAYQNLDVARIALATSVDGRLWNDIYSEPILGPDGKSWDGHAAYKPSVWIDYERKRILLWYNGRKNRREMIGLAILDDLSYLRGLV